MQNKARLFDKRVIDRNLDKGLITQADIAEHLANLPDMESEAEPLLVDVDDTDDLDDGETSESNTESYNFDAPENVGPRNVYDF